jgi:quinol monooxygenase YgiN
MIIVMGYMQVQPEHLAQFKRRLAQHCALVAQFDGCAQYSFSEDMAEPGKIWVAERWRDRAAQAAHMAGDHMAAFNMLMKYMPLISAQIESYETDDLGQWLIRAGPGVPKLATG